MSIPFLECAVCQRFERSPSLTFQHHRPCFCFSVTGMLVLLIRMINTIMHYQKRERERCEGAEMIVTQQHRAMWVLLTKMINTITPSQKRVRECGKDT